jgi:hypothetical protein
MNQILFLVAQDWGPRKIARHFLCVARMCFCSIPAASTIMKLTTIHRERLQHSLAIYPPFSNYLPIRNAVRLKHYILGLSQQGFPRVFIRTGTEELVRRLSMPLLWQMATPHELENSHVSGHGFIRMGFEQSSPTFKLCRIHVVSC